MATGYKSSGSLATRLSSGDPWLSVPRLLVVWLCQCTKSFITVKSKDLSSSRAMGEIGADIQAMATVRIWIDRLYEVDPHVKIKISRV